MRLLILILILTQTSCTNDSLGGTYKAFWYETYHELDLNETRFNYKVEGHLGNYNINGVYIKQNDTIYLETNKLPNKFLLTNDKCIIELESGYEFCKRTQNEWLSKQFVLNKNRIENYDFLNLINFPQIELDDLFKYSETSGLVEKSPSKKYFNPDTEGIFVFYTLFSKSENQVAEIGTLITHTHYQEKYGWSSEDKDQKFIELNLNSEEIVIGKNIQVGRDISDFVPELGMPILKNESIAIFAGSENLICIATVEINRVTSIKYGKYNFRERVSEDFISKFK